MTLPLKKASAALLAGLILTVSASTMAIVPVSALEPHGTGLKMRNWLVNDPDYSFSEDYRTSQWYQNFSTLRLGDNDRNNVLRVAISQLGYHEGDSVEDFDGRNTKGTGNYMEYGRLLVPCYNNSSYDWCACFVNWCLNQARFDKASSEISCGNWVTELKSMEMWQSSAAYGGTYVPKPADFIFFDWDGNGKWPDHIGLVLYATATHVYTIEGNTKTDDVGLRSYPLSDKQVLGYGTPPYAEGTEPTMDFSYRNGMPAGIYVVGDTEAALTDCEGQNPSDKIPVGSTVTFLSETDLRVQVSYKGKTGFLPKSSVCLLTQSFTLSYDANGGANPPADMTAHQAIKVNLSQTIPTLRGDTFLGWSTVPYNCKVDYAAGEAVTLTGDTTLYAVWEKRSVDLAREAAAKGLLPEYNRPDTTENSGALLFRSLTDGGVFTDCINAQFQFEEDSEAGRIPAFTAAEAGAPSAVTFSYAAFCEALELPPVTAKDVASVILRIKSRDPNGLTLKLGWNGQAETAPLSAADSTQWQYMVFDLPESFTGDLQSLELDWQSAEGATVGDLLVSEIWFAPNAAVKDAVLQGKYVFPPTESEEETDAPTSGDGTDKTPSSDGPALPSEDDVSSTVGGTGDDTAQSPTRGEGCRSSLASTASLATVCGASLAAFRKKRKEN